MAVRDTASLLVGLVFLFHTWGVWGAVVVNMEDRVEVLKGSTAEITCMFTSDEGIGGMNIQWAYITSTGEKKEIFYQDATVKQIVRNTMFTDRINVSGPASGANGGVVLTIHPVQLKDELEFICMVGDLSGGVAEGRTQLKVFHAPERPTIEGATTGFSANADKLSRIGICEVKNGFPKPNITWYRDNMPLNTRKTKEVEVEHRQTVESSGLMSVSSVLNKKVMKEDKDAQFYCEVSYFLPAAVRMTETNRINITVFYPSTAVRVWVESPKGKIKEGDTVEIRCEGNGNSIATLSLSNGPVDYPVENNAVVLHNVTRIDNFFQCTSFDIDTAEEISANVTVSVNYLDPAVVMPSDTIVVTQGGELKATCNALSSLKTNTAWFKNGKEISRGHTLILKDATFDNAGTYTCVVTVPEIERMETSAMLRVNVEGIPEIIKPDNTEIEEIFDNTVKLSCVVRGFPAPSITWTTADGKVLKEASQTETDKGSEGLLEVRVTSDMTVLCSASNKHGADKVTFNIKATASTTTPTTTTTTSTTSTTTTIISSATVKAETPEKIKKGGSGVVIAVIIICILLLAILGSVLYFLYKTGRICNRSGKQDITKEKSNKDNIVVEMKSDNTEEAILLGVNGEKQPSSDQVDI